jgi:hypothetical protein
VVHRDSSNGARKVDSDERTGRLYRVAVPQTDRRMTERSVADDRYEKGDRESLEDVRDRLSEFIEGGGRGHEERSDESADGSTVAGSDEPDSSGEVIDSDAGTPGAEPERSDLVVKAAVRERIENMAVASDFYEPLNEAIGELLSDAARRAEGNGRKTVQARDL